LEKKTEREVAIAIARILKDKKAEDILVLNIKKRLFFADFFVISTVKNERQAAAIAQEVEEKMGTFGIRKIRKEGANSGWLILDTGGVVVHLFNPHLRNFYALSDLWGDAPKTKWEAKNLSKESKR